MDNKERDKKEILRLVAEYCNKYHKPKAFCEGDKIHYAARVYGEEEMTNLVDSALDFWLTSGEYTEKFENDFAAFLGVKKAFLVNSLCSLISSKKSLCLLARKAKKKRVFASLK